MRQKEGSPGKPTNNFQAYLYKITRLKSADQFAPLVAALHSEDPISFGDFFYLQFLFLYLEFKKLELDPKETFSSEIMMAFVSRAQNVMSLAANATTSETADLDGFTIFSLLLQLLILRFQTHFLESNQADDRPRDNGGLTIPPLSIDDVLEQAYLLQEEIIKAFSDLKEEANKVLLKNSQHLATHNSQEDEEYFRIFNGEISDLRAWQFYQLDREFSEVLEWAYNRTSREKSLELKEHFLSLLKFRRYPYSNPGMIRVFKQHQFSYAILNRTSDNSERFELFWENFEKCRQKLCSYAIQYTIGYRGKSYDPEYVRLIRQFFRFHFQLQIWSQLHPNAEIADFSNENSMRLFNMWHSTEAILGVYLWHSKIEFMNLFRPEAYFTQAFKKILEALKQNKKTKFSSPEFLDILLSTVLHKIVLQFKAVLARRQVGLIFPNPQDNPFLKDYVPPYNAQLEETFWHFIPKMKASFKNKKDGEFFFEIANMFCQFHSLQLGNTDINPQEFWELLVSKINLPKENHTERSLMLECFARYFQVQLMKSPGLKNAIELIESYSTLLKFLEGKTPSFLMTLGVLEDIVTSFLTINRKNMTNGAAKSYLGRVDEARKKLLERCKRGAFLSESTTSRKVENPKKAGASTASKKKPETSQAPSKSAAPAVVKISLQEKYLLEYKEASTLLEKTSALVRLASVSETLSNTQKWVEEFFRVIFVENLGNEALAPQIEEMMSFLESQKWIPLTKKSAFPKSVLEFLGVFFKRKDFDNLKNEAERVESILSIMSRFQITAEMKQWFEHFLESVARTPDLNLNAQIQSILEKLKEFNIIPFSRKITISPDFFRQEADSSSVLDFFAARKIPVYIFGGATRDFIVEQNRPKKHRIDKITPEDIDIFVALGKNDLQACLRDRFGSACSVMGGDKSYYIKISFPGGSSVDVVSLGEEASEPLLLSLVRKTDSFDFNINCGIYSVQDNVYYSFRGAFENIKNLKFSFATPHNGQIDEPKHIFRTMALLAKYLSKSLEFSLSDEELYLQKLAILKNRWPQQDALSSDITESERKLVNNVVLNSYCRGNANFTFLVSMRHQSFTVLFPSLIEFIGSEGGREYLEACCKEADLTFRKKELKNAHFSYRIGYLLSLFFCQPILAQNDKAKIQGIVSHHVQSCLFWTHYSTRNYVETNIQNARKRGDLSIFAVANLWITEMASRNSSLDSDHSPAFVNGANGLL